MFKHYLIALVSLFCSYHSFSQQKIDSHLAFQDDPAKEYSLYLPATYDGQQQHGLMLAFHPFGPGHWNAMTWRDTLMAFAEANQLILFCPDGGPDGMVDDPADTAFTTLLLNQLPTQYAIDTNRVFVMGFSWGGKMVYSYGLQHAHRFAGFMPIGPIIEGIQGFEALSPRAEGKPFHLIHGSTDSPNLRYHPVKNALEGAGACTNANLLAGVGHTFDFPNRNAVLSSAFQALNASTCAQRSVHLDRPLTATQVMAIYPNPLGRDRILRIEFPGVGADEISLKIYGARGQLMKEILLDPHSKMFFDKTWRAGIYHLQLTAGEKRYFHKLIIP